LVPFVSLAKMAEPMEMPSAAGSGGPKEPRNTWVSKPQGKGAILGGCPSHCKALSDFAAVYAETAERIEIPFVGANSRWPRNHVLDGVKIPHGKGQFWGLSLFKLNQKKPALTRVLRPMPAMFL